MQAMTKDLAIKILRLEKERDAIMKQYQTVFWESIVGRAQGFVDCLFESSTKDEQLNVLRQIQD